MTTPGGENLKYPTQSLEGPVEFWWWPAHHRGLSHDPPERAFVFGSFLYPSHCYRLTIILKRWAENNFTPIRPEECLPTFHTPIYNALSFLSCRPTTTKTNDTLRNKATSEKNKTAPIDCVLQDFSALIVGNPWKCFPKRRRIYSSRWSPTRRLRSSSSIWWGKSRRRGQKAAAAVAAGK